MRLYIRTNLKLVQFSANQFADTLLVKRVGRTLNVTIIAFTIAAQLQIAARAV